MMANSASPSASPCWRHSAWIRSTPISTRVSGSVDYLLILHLQSPCYSHEPWLINRLSASCGSWPKAVSDQLKALWAKLEAQPDLFSEFSQGQVLQEARLGIAQLVHAAVSECVFVSNATTGIFTVLYNHHYEERDVVVTLSTTYGAIDHAIASLAETRPLQARKVEFEFPTTGQDIVSRFEATVAQIKAEGLRPRLAVLETVVSIPAVRMPFEKLIRVCQREGIMTLVDGAHSVGQFEVNLEELQPDFFVADCHKYATHLLQIFSSWVR